MPNLEFLTLGLTAIVLAGLGWLLYRTRAGLAMRAAAENFEMARLLGVRADRVIALSFAISGALAAAVGVLLVMQTGQVSPTMGLTPVLVGFVAVMIGGFGRMFGAVLGGLLLGIVSSLLGAYLPEGLAALPRRDRLQPAGRDPDLQAAGPARRRNRGGAGVSGVRLRSRSSLGVSLLVPLALVALTVAVGANGTPSLRGTVTMILCNLIIVLGLQVFIGNSGVYSFGQLGFASAGAYVAALLTLPAAFAALQTPALPHLIAAAQLGPLLSTLIAAAACGLLAAVVGLPLMRTSTLAIPISTFAFLIVVYNVLANWDRGERRQRRAGQHPEDDQRRVGRPLGGRGRRGGARLQMVGERLSPAGDPRGRGGRPLARDQRDRGAADRIRAQRGAVRDRRRAGGAPVGRSQPDHLLLRRDGDDGDDAGRSAAPAASSGRCWGRSRWRA